MRELLQQLRQQQHIGAADYHLGLSLLQTQAESGEAALLAALAAAAVRRGDTCLSLDSLAQGDGPVAALLRERTLEPAAWIQRALASSLIDRLDAGSPSESEAVSPLVAQGSRLYLRRYWQHEQQVAEHIGHRATWVNTELDRGWLARRLDALFGSTADVLRQRQAAATALLRRLCVITGGPGTGKTYSVARLLALHVEHAGRQGRRPPSIALLAPTGKAAVRLTESVQAAVAEMALADGELPSSALTASTVHRALGSIAGSSTRFRHGPRDPLPADLVVVDEASMIDLGLMARLLAAVDGHAHLVLLGDKDQLASVEAGAVLGDICQAALGQPWSAAHLADLQRLGCTGDLDEREAASESGTSRLRDCVVVLQHSRRYDPAGSIGRIARAIQSGQGQEVVEIARDPVQAGVALCSLSEEMPLSGDLQQSVVDGYCESLQIDDPEVRLRAMARYRVLCAHRVGRAGSFALNVAIERDFQQRTWLQRQESSYHGRPILITQNDHALRLYNGDVGVCLRGPGSDGARRELRAYFMVADGALRALPPGVLPAHETVFAMTVHKSQGSEYERVAVVLGNKLSPVMTRELLYTAITRAQKSVQIFASPEVLRACVERRVQRSSGLVEVLGQVSCKDVSANGPGVSLKAASCATPAP